MKNVGRMKFGKRENSEKTPKNPDITHHIAISGHQGQTSGLTTRASGR